MTYTPGQLVNIASISKGVEKWPKCPVHGWEEDFYYRYEREESEVFEGSPKQPWPPLGAEKRGVD